MPLTPATARKIVPATRMAFGVTSQVAPGLVMRSALIAPEANPDGPLLTRVFGSRAFVLGALSAGLAGQDAARTALRTGAVMDVFDVGSFVLAHRAGRLSAPGLAFNAAIGLGFAALGAIASRDG